MRCISDERSFKEVVLNNTYAARHFQINSAIMSTPTLQQVYV